MMISRIEPLKAWWAQLPSVYAFAFSQAILGSFCIALIAVWRFYLGDIEQGLIDLGLCVIFSTLGYLATRERYHNAAIRSFGVVYSIAIWVVIDKVGPDGLYWAYAVCAAVFFSSRRKDAFILSLITYLVCVYAVWPQVNGLSLAIFSVTYGLLVFFISYFAKRQYRIVSDLRDLVNTDPLTGCQNRRAFDIRLTKMFKDDLSSEPYSLIMVDVDHFKQVNDNYGHDIGDFVLQRIVAHMTDELGERGQVYRFGGEEFMAVVECDEQCASQYAESLREKFAQTSFIRESQRPITISAGVAEVNWQADAGDWVKRADQAMYMAKEGGRNRVCVAAG